MTPESHALTLDPKALYLERLSAHIAMAHGLASLQPALISAAEAAVCAIRAGGKVLFFGNGGSAADAQHLAAELVNRFVLERPALPGLALTTDTSNLTAIANDYAFEHLFSRQLEALGRTGDVAWAISTSGNSSNVIAGLKACRALGIRTIALTGEGGGRIAREGLADFLLAVPSRDTARIQEGHLFLGHLFCELVERTLAGTDARAAQPVGTGSPTAPVSGPTTVAACDSAASEAAAATSTPVPSTAEAPAYFVHPSSIVDPGCTIGEGTKIWFFNHVQTGSKIGKHCIIGQNVNIDRDAVVGDRVKIQNNVSVYKGVMVEDDAFLGPSMVFTNVINPRSHVNRKNEFLPTRVGRGSSLGANCTIVCGHSIGEYAFVGAGAVVTKDVPPYGLVTGNPAFLRGWMCRCGIKLNLPTVTHNPLQATCTACSRPYTLDRSGLTCQSES